MKTEQRTFTMHPHLLFDVIRRQAGSLDQAVREGVMNAVDARATRINLKITTSEIVLEDNGTGFKNRKQIETCFETFGQPHEEGEKKVFGAFRMGRGQLFAYGRNVWTTGQFVMDVDIANMGLDYELREVPAITPGCTVRVVLYKKLNSYEVEQLIQSLRRSLKWLSTSIHVNDAEESITTDPATRPEGYWTYVNDDAYVKLIENDQSNNNIEIYNMGVFVTNMLGRWQHQTVVVSKKALTLNFARNEVMQGCPVWNRVKGLVQIERKVKQNPKKARKKGSSHTLTLTERDELARQLVEGETPSEDGKHLRLLQDIDGRHWSANMLAQVVKDYRNLITVASESDERAKKIRANGLAFPLTPRTRTRFLANNCEELADTLNRLWGVLHVKGAKFGEIWEDSYEKVQLIPTEQLTPLEMAVIQTLTHSMGYLRGTVRKIRFGITYGPVHWTDGYSYIGLDREWLLRNRVDVRGWFNLAQVVQHELLHECSSLNKNHAHGDIFYREMYSCYENMVCYAIACFQMFPHYAGSCGVSEDNVHLDRAAEEAEALSVVDQLALDLLGEATDGQEPLDKLQKANDMDVQTLNSASGVQDPVQTTGEQIDNELEEALGEEEEEE